METVEETTASIPAAAESDPPPGRDSKKRARPTTEEQEPETQTPARPDPWAGLLQAGLNLLEQFAAASGSNARSEQAASAAFPVVRDAKTGEAYVKLPLPSPQILQQVLAALTTLVGTSMGK